MFAKSKKLFSVLGVALLAGSLLVGCGGEKKADNKVGDVLKIGANLELVLTSYPLSNQLSSSLLIFRASSLVIGHLSLLFSNL